MLAFVNGRFLPEKEATISIFDRSFLYGDGIFEVVRVYKGRPFLWDLHLQRWEAGCSLLKIKSPVPPKELLRLLHELLKRNETKEGIARIQLTRGIGPRTYSPKDVMHPSLLMTLHPSPPPPKDPLKVITSTWRVRAEDPLATAKHSNKLLQVLARAEADEKHADEALLLNDRGEVVEASSSNLFWIEGNSLCTAPVEAGVLPGTTRAFVMELGKEAGMDILENRLQPTRLLQVGGVFLTSCSLEIAEVGELNGKELPRSPAVKELQKAYSEATTD